MKKIINIPTRVFYDPNEIGDYWSRFSEERIEEKDEEYFSVSKLKERLDQITQINDVLPDIHSDARIKVAKQILNFILETK